MSHLLLPHTTHDHHFLPHPCSLQTDQASEGTWLGPAARGRSEDRLGPAARGRSEDRREPAARGRSEGRRRPGGTGWGGGARPARWRRPRCCAPSPGCWPRPGSRAPVSVPPRAGTAGLPACPSQAEPGWRGRGWEGCGPGPSCCDLRRPAARAHACPHPGPSAPYHPPPTSLRAPPTPCLCERTLGSSCPLCRRRGPPGALSPPPPRSRGPGRAARPR